jgi:hypothetical protein
LSFLCKVVTPAQAGAGIQKKQNGGGQAKGLKRELKLAVADCKENIVLPD